MEHFKAAVSTLVSIASSTYAWISIAQAKDIAALFASIIAAVATYFSIRYYYYATKEKKQSIKLNKSK